MEDSNATRKTFVVPDIKPLDLYDSTRGKICASVGWLLAKSYGNAEKVPVELREPFYCDQYDQEHLKPPVTRLLLSSELYCRTYTLLVGGSAPEEPPPADNAALLRLLADRGLPPTDLDAPVGDADLRRKPIKMSAHLALMDALMAVGAMETVVTVTARGAAELLGGGSSWQEPLLHWVNELNQKLRRAEEGSRDDPAQTIPEPESVQPSCPTRWYWKLVPLRYRKDKTQSRQKPVFPIVNEVKDLSTGCAVVAVMHYYCPDLLRLEDVCMKDAMSTADSLSNLHFIREFCESCLKSCCSLALEDMLYAPPELQCNWLSFLAELLNWFEVRRPEFVQPRDSSDGSRAAVPAGSSKSGSPSIFRKPFVPISSHLSQSGPLTQSTSLSHLENAGKTKIRKPLSRPLSAVSFSIPFGLDSDVDVVMGDPLITRSVSSDQLTPAGRPAATRGLFAGPEDVAHPLHRPNGPQRASWVTQSPSANAPRLAENGHRESETGELPTIEEALQIIHNESKLEPRLHPDGAPDGFYLHSPDDQAGGGGRHAGGVPAPVSCSAPSRSGMMYQPAAEPREPVRTRNPSEGSRDDDSVLRDGSVDSDASEDPPKTPAAAAAAAATPPYRSHGKEPSDSGVKMTSFAERKKKHGLESPKAGEPPGGAPGGAHAAAAAATAATEEGPGKSPKLTNEMSELGVRLEEKRKAIEAQKKRIEAIFAKHRQRLGKSAFLQLKKEQREDEGPEENGQGGGPLAAAAADGDLTLEERLARMEEEEEKEHDKRRPSRDEDGDKAGVRADRKAAAAAAPLGDYNNAVSKLTAALSSLQSDMQRLSDQQSQLIRKKPAAPSNRSWVIPPSPKTSTPARSSREPSRDLSSAGAAAAPSSPSPSRRVPSHATPPPKSPHAHRRAQSAPPKSPKHQPAPRPPLDLKGPGMSRVLTAPRNVDRIPHLRRVDPWQCKVQTSSSFTIGTASDDDGPAAAVSDLYPSPDPTPAHTPVSTPPLPPLRLPAAEDALSEAGSNDNQSIFSMELDTPRKERPAVGGSSSGAPSECSFESDAAASNGHKRGSLIEVSLLGARGDGREGEDEEQGLPDPFSDSMSDVTEPELRSGLGFFFKDDQVRPEDEMAQRRAALLEKQQKRADEMKKKKLEQEKEKEANRPAWMTIEGWGDKGDSRPSTPGTPTGSSTPTAEGTPQRRGDFTRLEYERRHQLKVMEDLGKVLRQKPTTVRGVKNRPKTVFRDDSGLSRSPAKGFMETRLNKQYSHSTMNLSSVANDLTVRKSPSRSHSPGRRSSPGRVSSQNGDRDWENGSTISSPASIPEYTGPKLYKEPSFKSNKFIIHNAISRCCLAGKVNEPQKNKIVEEMEKSPANHFLILFRDASCQFRAVYTMNAETEEMVRLTGVGPRVIGPDMVESIFKYSSDRKQFTAIPSKTMSMSVDAFTIPAQLWQKRPGTPKKLGTPK